MARKDRERARRRHAIERARRETGWQPTPKPDRPPSKPGSRPAAKPRGGRPAASRAELKRLKVGDVDRRGRVFQRNQLLHPRTALLVYFAILAVAVAAWFVPTLRPWSLLPLAFGFLIIADTQPTYTKAAVWVALSVLLLAAGLASVLTGPAPRG